MLVRLAIKEFSTSYTRLLPTKIKRKSVSREEQLSSLLINNLQLLSPLRLIDK